MIGEGTTRKCQISWNCLFRKLWENRGSGGLISDWLILENVNSDFRELPKLFRFYKVYWVEIFTIWQEWYTHWVGQTRPSHSNNKKIINEIFPPLLLSRLGTINPFSMNVPFLCHRKRQKILCWSLFVKKFQPVLKRDFNMVFLTFSRGIGLNCS